MKQTIITIVLGAMLSMLPSLTQAQTPAYTASYYEFTQAKAKGDIYVLFKANSDEDMEKVWIDYNGNNQKDEGEALSEHDQDSKPVYSLKKIPNTLRVYGPLTVISMNEDDITTLDVSKMPMLKELYAIGNKLETLDLTKNINLETLQLSRNKLSTLDVSKNVKLKLFDAPEAGLTTIDLSPLTLLKSTDLSDNNLSQIDATKNTQLQALYLGGNNELSSLNVKKNPALRLLDISNTKMTDIDLSGNPELIGFSMSKSKISHIDFSKNTKLEEIYLHNTSVKELDLSKNPLLRKVVAFRTLLSKLDLSGKPNLKAIYIYACQIVGNEMDIFVKSLPTVNLKNNKGNNGEIFIIDTADPREKNVCTTKHVKQLKEKKWNVYDYKGYENYGYNDYKGSKPSSTFNLLKANISYSNIGGNIVLHFPDNLLGQKFFLYNQDGKQVMSQEITKTTEEISGLVKGVYILRIGNNVIKVVLSR